MVSLPPLLLTYFAISFHRIAAEVHRDWKEYPRSQKADQPGNRRFLILNSCDIEIWPAFLTSNNTGPCTSGFLLTSGQSQEILVSADWSGRVWGRTHCLYDTGTDELQCATGDCDGEVSCNSNGRPPATLAEFTLDGYSGLSYWDISLVSGFNIPMRIRSYPDDTILSCPPLQSRTNNLQSWCPTDLLYYQDGNPTNVVGCMSACDRFAVPQYCCTFPSDTSDTCPPSSYSEAFKDFCPAAYSYAFDDKSSLIATPSRENSWFEIEFCPIV